MKHIFEGAKYYFGFLGVIFFLLVLASGNFKSDMSIGGGLILVVISLTICYGIGYAKNQNERNSSKNS